jgi:N-acetylglucosaminyldiphosphoundecaprenol N-acetyl-beta-D-mannosaminyltransferase
MPDARREHSDLKGPSLALSANDEPRTTNYEHMSDVVTLFGMQIDRVRMPEAVARLRAWIAADETACRYVVTPNVDHAVMFHERSDLRAAYSGASLVLADGFPVVLASRLLGRSLPERVAGSDLAPALFEGTTDGPGLSVYLLGAAKGVGERAAARIAERWPNVQVVGTYSPPLGFEHDPRENDAIVERINAVRPDVLVVGLGAPKQELWIARHRERLQAKTALCIGATIDFLAGEKARAPRWMQRCGLEWLHRLTSEPKRLFRRYAHDARVFPRLVWNEWRGTAAQ